MTRTRRSASRAASQRLTLTGATNTNGILGGWATVLRNYTVTGVGFNQTWATVNAQGVVGGLGDPGFPAYSANLITSSSNNASTNINIVVNKFGGTYSNVPTQTINSLRGAYTEATVSGPITLNLGTTGSASRLTIASGGIMSNSTNGTSLQILDGAGSGSTLTSGTDNLYFYSWRLPYSGGGLPGVTNIGVSITDGVNPIGLVKNGGGDLYLWRPPTPTAARRSSTRDICISTARRAGC